MAQEPSRRSAGVATMPGVPRALADNAKRQLDATELVPGEQLVQTTRYEIVEAVGEGGMGKIYRAFDPGMDRYLALKILKLDVPDVFRKRFRREAQIAANFSHPNLVRVLDVGEMPDRGLEWMAMEYLRGRDLGQIIDSAKPIAIPVILDIFRQTLEALEYIHTRAIAHCDIKPDNIFVTRDLYARRIVVVKLIDFGVCRRLDPPLELQQQISGDPRYIAPEQQVLNGPLDGRADLYSLGVSLFEALTLRHPFQQLLEVGVLKLLAAHRELPLPSVVPLFLHDAPAGVPERFDELLRRACAKNPDDRFPDARAMREALDALAD